jgi:putative glutamine amidotransferase
MLACVLSHQGRACLQCAGLQLHHHLPMRSETPLLIGLSARLYAPGSQGALPGVFTKHLHYLEQSVPHWVQQGPALPVMVPPLPSNSPVTLAHYAQVLDGLVLQGGNDVAPQAYGEAPLHPDWCGDPERDRYEAALIKAFVDVGKPVFGVCRGLQLINVVFGGTLLQDIPTQRPDALAHRELGRYENHFHRLHIEPGTRLAQLYPHHCGVSPARINSIHHQGIKDLAPGFVVEARCPDDGMVEAMRRSGPGFVAAVQWHPEFHRPGDPDHFDDGPLLQDFLAAAREVKAAGPNPKN